MNDEKMSEDNIQIDTALSKFEDVEKEQMERAEMDWISKERELYKKYERTHGMSNTSDGREVTWLEFKRKIGAVVERLSSDAVPITFLCGETEIHPTDITVGCEEAGDKLTLIIDLKEGGAK